MIKVNKIKIHLFKYKNKNPVLSSFGRMTFRSSLIVELIDQNDNSGFGEIWCNFPNHAGGYRFEIFKDYFANLLKNFDFEKPSAPYDFFYEKLLILANLFQMSAFFKINLKKVLIFGA